MDNTILILQEAEYIEFLFPEVVTTEEWLKLFGVIDKVIDANRFKIVIKLARTRWFDAAPLLSLTLLIAKLKQEKSREIVLHFPQPTIADYTGRTDQQIANPLFAFLYSHGFVHELIRHAEIWQDGRKIKEQDIQSDYSVLRESLAFPESFVTAPVVLDVAAIFEKFTTLSHWVNKYLQDCLHRLQKLIPDESFKNTYHSLFLFLFESLQNIYDHAYPHSDNKRAIIYLRYRNGLANPTLDAVSRAKLNNLLSREQSNAPRYFRRFAEENAGYFEVFVIDLGIGITKSFEPELIQKKYPFREILDRVIRQGIRNYPNRKKTKFGGLYILSRIITKGTLWMVDRNECFGEDFPIRAQIANTEQIFANELAPGLAVICRIGWDRHKSESGDWAQPQFLPNFMDSILHEAMIEDRNIYQKYFGKRSRELKPYPFKIWDERFKDQKVLNQLYPQESKKINFALWLPAEGLPKYDIYKTINAHSKELTNNSKTLIVADIADGEMNLYQYALDGTIFDERFTTRCETIILVSKSLSVLVITAGKIDKGYASYHINGLLTKQFLQEKPKSFAPDKSLLHLIEWLKTHESFLFWRNIFNKNEAKEFFLTGNIQWSHQGKNFQLDHYFNFAQTLTDELSLQLYDNWMLRLKALDKSCRFEGIDNLSYNITETFNLKNNLNKDNAPTISLGSVYVTGTTFDNLPRVGNVVLLISLFLNTKTFAGAVNIPHCFIWPDETFVNKMTTDVEQPHQRVGCSPVLAPYGWKYFTIPRYRHRDYPDTPIYDLMATIPREDFAKDIFTTVTVASPPDTYRTWQTNNILSLGHFEYENYHDLFKIDIPYAFDESWRLNDDLTQFLLQQITSALGIPLNALKVDEDVRASLIKTQIQQGQTVTQPAHLLVYPYHFSTEHIMKAIKACLPEPFRKRILSLIPIHNNTQNTPYLISPQIEQKIKLICQQVEKEEKEVPTALLFDTLRINGKTEREIRHLLRLSGIKKLQTITITDRQRLPIHSFEKNVFWRFDVPTLGNKSTCPICSILNQLTALQDVLSSDLLSDRVNTWKLNWGKKFRYSTDTEVHGIKPIEVQFTTSNKKNLGIYIDENNKARQIGGDSNQISINTSLGLTVYTCELLAMTSKDDIALDALAKETFPDEVVIETLCCNLLLYHSQISLGTKKKMVSMVFNAAKNKTEANNHTILAALVISLISDFDETALMDWCIGQGTTYLDVKNLDMLICLCLKAHNDERSPLNNLGEIKRLLKRNNNLLDINKEFHSELYNDYGDAHDTPLHKFRKELNINKDTLINAYNSLTKLRDLLSHYHSNDFSHNEKILDFESNKDLLDANLEELKSKIERYYFMEASSYNTQQEEIKENTIHHFLICLNILQDIHNRLFISVKGDDDSFPVIDRLNITVILSKESVGFLPERNIPVLGSSNVTNRWLVWNKSVEDVIKDILSNCKHAEQLTVSPWALPGEGSLHHMWVTLSYLSNAIQIECYDVTTKKASEIELAIKNKLKPSESYLKNIGASVHFKDFISPINHQEYLQTILTLPYV